MKQAKADDQLISRDDTFISKNFYASGYDFEDNAIVFRAVNMNFNGAMTIQKTLNSRLWQVRL